MSDKRANKGGRPKVQPGELRSSKYRAVAALTLAEKQELELEVRLQGFASEAAYIRSRLGFGAPAKSISPTSSIVKSLEERGVDVPALLQQDAIAAFAQEAGLEPAVFVRRMLEFSGARPEKRDRSALVSELNSLGVNINQLARAVNRGSDFTDHWQQLAARVEKALEKVLEP